MTGGKDGFVKLHDPDFKTNTKVDLTQVPDGYKGKTTAFKIVRLLLTIEN